MKKIKRLMLVMTLALVLIVGNKQGAYASTLDNFIATGWTVTQISTGKYMAVIEDVELTGFEDFILTISKDTTIAGIKHSTYDGGTLVYSRIKYYDNDTGTFLKLIQLRELVGQNASGYLNEGIYYIDASEEGVTAPITNYKVDIILYFEYGGTVTAVNNFLADHIGLYESNEMWLLAIETSGDASELWNAGYQSGLSTGISQGTITGYDSGYGVGYEDGVIDGEITGYAEGYNATEGESAILQVVGGVIGAVLSFFLFIATEFAIFGVTLLDVIIMLIILGAVIFVLKLVF